MNEKDRFEVMALMERRSIPEPNTGCWLWTAASQKSVTTAPTHTQEPAE
jgi:hypothetical protein